MPKEVVSFGIEPELHAEIDKSVEEENKRNPERDPQMNFSIWMRDAARQKLKREGANRHKVLTPNEKESSKRNVINSQKVIPKL